MGAPHSSMFEEQNVSSDLYEGCICVLTEMAGPFEDSEETDQRYN